PVVVAEDPVGGPPEAGFTVRTPLHHPDAVAPSAPAHDGLAGRVRDRVPARGHGRGERGPVPARARVPPRVEAGCPLVDGAVERSDIDRPRGSPTRDDDRATGACDRA